MWKSKGTYARDTHTHTRIYPFLMATLDWSLKQQVGSLVSFLCFPHIRTQSAEGAQCVFVFLWGGEAGEGI